MNVFGCLHVLASFWEFEYKMQHQEGEDLSLQGKQGRIALLMRLYRSNLGNWCFSCTARQEGELDMFANTLSQDHRDLFRINQIDFSTRGSGKRTKIGKIEGIRDFDPNHPAS